MTEQNNEEVQEISLEELEQLMEGSEDDKLPPIVISMEHYDADEFQRGLDETSYLAGRVTGLLNAGLSEQSVLDLILTLDTLKHNEKVSQVTKEMNVEIAKQAKITQDKHEL
jgi:hypothetical protein